MTSRERVLAALNLRQPDRVPIDFGSTVFTTITINALNILKRHLGIQTETEATLYVYQTAKVDEEILQRFGVDTRGLITKSAAGWKDVITDDGHHTDEWGILRRMSDAGYLDIVRSPFQDTFDETAMENFDWPDGSDPGRYEGMEERVAEIRRDTDAAVILNVFGGFTAISMFLRGFQGWFMDLLMQESLIEELLDRTLQFQLDSTAAALDRIGAEVDVVAFAEDYADQRGMMFSPELFRKLIKPRQAKLFGLVKEKSNAKVLLHSCGAVSEIIEDFIEAGVDALNPIQVSAAGMDPADLKKRFGDRLCFWGGIDTQKVLTKGTVEDVRKEVENIIRILGEGGGYILDAVHNIQSDVPPENVVAMFDAAREYGRY